MSGGNASSTGSSPRKSKGKSLAIVTKDSSTVATSPTPLASRLPSYHSSALRSAWIQRIIPLQSFKKPVIQGYTSHGEKGEGKGRDEDAATLVCQMDIEDEDDSFEFNKSENPSRSWMTVRKSVEDMQGSPALRCEADFDLPKAESPSNTVESEEKASASLDSKVIPVLEDITDLPTEQKENPSSPWFVRLSSKEDDRSAAAQDEIRKTLRAIRSFPPLKSGEQWPGTLKPTGLPPLRIPATRSPERGSRQVRSEQLPLLTPVSFPALFEEDEQASNTCSLPSNFVSDLHRNSDRTKSLPEKLLQCLSTQSSLSDTKSLSQDFLAANIQPAVDSISREADSASLRKAREAAQENSFSRIVSNSTERSNQTLYRSSSRSGQSSRQQLQRQIPFSNEQPENDRAYIKTRREERLAGAGKAAAGSSHLKANQLPVRGSQQWLQRWCSPNSTLHVITGSQT